MTDDGLILRIGKEKDIPFLAKTIREAEASGGPRSTYGVLFEMQPERTEEKLKDLLEEDLEGCEMGFSNFVVVTDQDGAPVGACAAWIEGDGNAASGFLRGQMLSYAFGPERWKAAQDGLRALSEVHPARTTGALQMESFYVDPVMRGRGLVQRMIAEHFARFDGQFSVAEIQMANHNRAARRSYEKAGFVLANELITDAPLLRAILGTNGMLLMQKRLNEHKVGAMG